MKVNQKDENICVLNEKLSFLIGTLLFSMNNWHLNLESVNLLRNKHLYCEVPVEKHFEN